MSTGRFVWYDLVTTDVPRARAFYAALFGWDVRPHGPDYERIHAGDRPIGGMVPMPPELGAPNHWIAYVTTDDLDATVAKVGAEGGRVYHREAIPNLGRWAVLADRQGAVFSAFEMTYEPPARPPEKGANHLSWAELHTSDPADALAFYRALFGWTSEAWGDDSFLVGAEHNAGIVKGRHGPPHWLLYVSVASADATAEAARAAGGTVVVEPWDIPEVGRFAVLLDPTGAAFAVMQRFSRAERAR